VRSAAPPRRETLRRIERITGTFRRRFSLPDMADAQDINTASVYGIVQIAIRKSAREKPRRIAVEDA
jgi:HSP20 family protein